MTNAVVVDLDGTLMNTNTFVRFIVFVCKREISKLRFRIPLQLFWLVLFRKCRIISSHELFKKRVLVASEKYCNENDMIRFSDSLQSYVNPKVLALFMNYQEKGFCTVLSSAAPACYVKLISEKYNFDSWCATKFPNSDDWHENVNEFKKKNTLRLLDDLDAQLAVLITDHYDDMPLLEMPKLKNYIVNSSESTLRELRKRNVDYAII